MLSPSTVKEKQKHETIVLKLVFCWPFDNKHMPYSVRKVKISVNIHV